MERVVPPSAASRRYPVAFTVVELLVVIAILVIMLSFLLPTLGEGKVMARRVECASHVRELSSATLAFVMDNKNKFPTHPSGPVSSYWAWGGKRGTEYNPQVRLINPYVTINRAVTEDDNEGVFEVFSCPSDNGAAAGRWNWDRFPTVFDTFGNSYFYNSGGNDNSSNGLHGKHMDSVRFPSSVILANDYAFSMYGWPWVPGPANEPFQHAYWHHGSEPGWGNVAFVDNHVKFFRATNDNPDYQNGPDWTFVYNGPN